MRDGGEIREDGGDTSRTNSGNRCDVVNASEGEVDGGLKCIPSSEIYKRRGGDVDECIRLMRILAIAW